MHTYTIHIHGETRGPFTHEQLSADLAAGAVAGDVLAWRPGQPEWLPLGTLLAMDAEGRPPALPNENDGYRATPDTAAYARGEKPTNWLVPAILSTLCCCLPFGIPAIIFAVKANTAYETGDAVTTASAAKQAKLFVILAVTFGILSYFCTCGFNSFGMSRAILDGADRHHFVGNP